MIRRTLAVLALGSALTALAPATVFAEERSEHARQEYRDRDDHRERSGRDERARRHERHERRHRDRDWDRRWR